MAQAQQAVNEFEVMVVKCIRPKNGRFAFNGYLNSRVYLGQETEIPRWHPIRDPETQEQMRDADGNLRWRENKKPKWAEFVAYEDRTPKARPSVVEAPMPKGVSKTPPKMRAADTPVGA